MGEKEETPPNCPQVIREHSICGILEPGLCALCVLSHQYVFSANPKV